MTNARAERTAVFAGCVREKVIKVSSLKLNKNNPRQIKDEKFDRLKKSIKDFPQMMELRPIVIDDDGTVLGGNMRLRAIKALGMKDIPDDWVMQAKDLTEAQKKEFIIKDNSAFGEYDWDQIANEWSDLPLADWGLDIPCFEQVEAEGESEPEEKAVTLADRFLVPPFSVLDARQGYWQDRKRAWLALGIQSELGRGDTVLFEAEQVTTEGLNYYRNLAKKNRGGQVKMAMHNDPKVRQEKYRRADHQDPQ